MTTQKLISIIENGKQVGISKIINCNGTDIAYTYAVQKKKGKYIVYMDEVDLGKIYENEFDDTEKVTIYDSLEEFINHFEHKYGVTFEDFHISKGQKFFNEDIDKYIKTD